MNLSTGNEISHKCEQILVLLEIEYDIAQSDDDISNKVLATNLIIKELIYDVSALLCCT